MTRRVLTRVFSLSVLTLSSLPSYGWDRTDFPAPLGADPTMDGSLAAASPILAYIHFKGTSEEIQRGIHPFMRTTLSSEDMKDVKDASYRVDSLEIDPSVGRRIRLRFDRFTYCLTFADAQRATSALEKLRSGRFEIHINAEFFVDFNRRHSCGDTGEDFAESSQELEKYVQSEGTLNYGAKLKTIDVVWLKETATGREGPVRKILK